MISLRSQPRLDILQFLSQLFQDLKQNVHESTLWVCDRGIAQPFSLDLQETETLLILKIQFHHSSGSLELQITPETVLVRGNRLTLLEDQNYSELEESEFSHAPFQSLIPLPSSIQPQTAIAELSGATLTLTMMKSYEPQRTAKITAGDFLEGSALRNRAQPLPDAMAIRSESMTTLAEFN